MVTYIGQMIPYNLQYMEVTDNTDTPIKSANKSVNASLSKRIKTCFFYYFHYLFKTLSHSFSAFSFGLKLGFLCDLAGPPRLFQTLFLFGIVTSHPFHFSIPFLLRSSGKFTPLLASCFCQIHFMTFRCPRTWPTLFEWHWRTMCFLSLSRGSLKQF